MLPTDPKFRELSPEQKALLFHAFLELPDDATLRAAHQAARKVAPTILDEQTKEDLQNVSGYTDEQISWIEAQLKLAGLAAE